MSRFVGQQNTKKHKQKFVPNEGKKLNSNHFVDSLEAPLATNFGASRNLIQFIVQRTMDSCSPLAPSDSFATTCETQSVCVKWWCKLWAMGKLNKQTFFFFFHSRYNFHFEAFKFYFLLVFRFYYLIFFYDFFVSRLSRNLIQFTRFKKFSHEQKRVLLLVLIIFHVT